MLVWVNVDWDVGCGLDFGWLSIDCGTCMRIPEINNRRSNCRSPPTFYLSLYVAFMLTELFWHHLANKRSLYLKEAVINNFCYKPYRCFALRVLKELFYLSVLFSADFSLWPLLSASRTHYSMSSSVSLILKTSPSSWTQARESLLSQSAWREGTRSNSLCPSRTPTPS